MTSRVPVWDVVEDGPEVVLIRDVGPWDRYPTITNGAEAVVRMLAPVLRGRRLEYLDSDGIRSQILVECDKFAGFTPAGKDGP